MKTKVIGRIVLSVMAVMLATACGADDVESTGAAITAPAPSCHEVATAWCDAQQACTPSGVGETCHEDMHDFCTASPEDAAVSRACVDALLASCVEGVPLACVNLDANGIGTSPSDPREGSL